MCSNTVRGNSVEQPQKSGLRSDQNCVQLDDKVNNESHPGSSSDNALENNGAGRAVKKVVFKIGSQLLGETEFLSESEEENLVMDFSENEEEKLFT